MVEAEDIERRQEPCCCSPHVFTSVLLGVLSCVLMTGGVFLAFHRWDPMWLLVSGVGVVLILIGTVLHCCHHLSDRPSGGKVHCCHPPDHHLLPTTEQLLPLTNARSVSQLSLNMLPGYFPPVVTAYGIEQHSAVVQNINRLVQQQQPSTGKSFILLSLPQDATSANVQNLVATVYQLDGSRVESPATEATPTAAAAQPDAPVPLVLKHAEVQTSWPTTSAVIVGPATTGADNQPVASPSSSTQTEDVLPPANLIDCSPDIIAAPICDNSNGHIPPSSAVECVLVDIPTTSPAVECSSVVLVDIPTTMTPLLDSPPADSSDSCTTNDTLLDSPAEENSSTSAQVPENVDSNLDNVVDPELLSGNVSETDMDDGELLGRSSPPPSYEDVTLEGESVGALGLAYGTI